MITWPRYWPLIGLQLSDESTGKNTEETETAGVPVTTWSLEAKLLTRPDLDSKCPLQSLIIRITPFTNYSIFFQSDRMKKYTIATEGRRQGLLIFVCWLFPDKKIPAPSGCRCSIRPPLYRCFYSNSVNGGNFVAIIHRDKRDSHTNQDQHTALRPICLLPSKPEWGLELSSALLCTVCCIDISNYLTSCLYLIRL